MFENTFFDGIGLEYGVVWCLGRADVCKAASLCRQVLSRLPRPEFVVGNMCELDVHWVYIFFCLISFQFPRKACYSFDQGFGDGKWHIVWSRFLTCQAVLRKRPIFATNQIGKVHYCSCQWYHLVFIDPINLGGRKMFKHLFIDPIS